MNKFFTLEDNWLQKNKAEKGSGGVLNRMVREELNKMMPCEASFEGNKGEGYALMGWETEGTKTLGQVHTVGGIARAGREGGRGEENMKAQG